MALHWPYNLSGRDIVFPESHHHLNTVFLPILYQGNDRILQYFSIQFRTLDIVSNVRGLFTFI